LACVECGIDNVEKVSFDKNLSNFSQYNGYYILIVSLMHLHQFIILRMLASLWTQELIVIVIVD